MKKTIITSLVLTGVLALATSVVFANKDEDKSNGNSSSKSKSEKVKELKDFEKPTKEKTNASIYKEKIDEVSTELKETAEEEKIKGEQKREEKTVEKKVNNPDVGEQKSKKVKTREEIAGELEDVAKDAEEIGDETVEAIKKVEKQNKLKKMLVGTDYKNLGQLRSSLVHNRNQIRKLTALAESITDEETKTAIQEQLITMMQERERIKTVISDNEEGFSLLGWVFRLMNGYPKDSIDEQEEADLEDEVFGVLNEEIEDVDEDEVIENEQDELDVIEGA